MAHPELLRLSDRPGEPVSRYTTRTVWEAEQHVLRAAGELDVNNDHDIGAARRSAIESSAKFAIMTAEQLRAFRHATAAQGLALIDGQAGTGKSHLISAIRTAYEATGYRVIGLGPTNAVADDMRMDGFSHARTIHAELFALANDRTSWTQKPPSLPTRRRCSIRKSWRLSPHGRPRPAPN
ncbi:MAG: AAA family ATPase [Acetobacteraceae bacterium]|nr:AAA family ATPase [Acetobacteraceae bacterium]